ncbi:MAG: hypothetical protein ACOYEV_06285 [Candidatus Nanopelagicales bacterium]
MALMLAALLSVPAIVGQWATSVLGNNANFVATLTPLASDPAVQEAVATQIGRQVTDSVGLGDILGQALQEAVATSVEALLQTPIFATTWEAATSAAQRVLIAGLRGDGGLDASGEAVTLDLSPVLEQVRDGLVDQGLTAAETADVPEVRIALPLVAAETVRQGQTFYKYVAPVAHWLPWVVAALLISALALARRRPRMLALVGLVGAGSALLVSLLLGVGGAQFSQALGGTAMDSVSVTIFDHIVGGLSRYWPGQLLAGVALVVIGVAWSLWEGRRD